jgi:hypothetical protein
VPLPALSLLALAWLYAYGVTAADAPLSLAGLTLQPREKLILLLVCTALFVVYPLYTSCLAWLATDGARRLFLHLVAYTLMTINVLAIIVLIVEPYLPPPGGEGSSELCFDLSAPAVRFDRKAVALGPCFRFDVAFVGSPV